jgi:hypothetical protein
MAARADDDARHVSLAALQPPTTNCQLLARRYLPALLKYIVPTYTRFDFNQLCFLYYHLPVSSLKHIVSSSTRALPRHVLF